MLYVLLGDRDATNRKLEELTKALKTKRPDAEYVRVTNETAGAISLRELLFRAGLFELKQIVVLDGVLKELDAFDFIPDMETVEHVVILREEKVDAKTKKLLEKHAHKLQVFEKKESKKDFSPFPLADAVLQRNKKRAWQLLQEGYRNGIGPEELHGILLWQFKALALATHIDSVKDSGLSPFVYKKAKGAVGTWVDTLPQKHKELAGLLYNARMRGEDSSHALERFVLSL